ncbi:sensor histidine kinase [Salana multivorans]
MNGPRAAVESRPGARRLTHGITATWWYTVSAVLIFEAIFVGSWAAVAVGAGAPMVTRVVIGVGGIAWILSTLLLLSAYRHRAEPGASASSFHLAVPLGTAVAYGAVGGIAAGTWLLALAPIAQALVLLRWPAGVRTRLLAVVTIALGCLATVDGLAEGGVAEGEWVPLVQSVLMPIMTVSSLWWWDVLVVLDRVRASEARLAATQERLRVATDVHDLQGHHLQVIALQLELAERLHASDPGAALEQLRAARRSVDEARQGTRDLATRFRSVPLGDELANARDLLIAAGLDVEATIAPDADLAPATDLGPVIRETTTNVLRHGGGHRARLVLSRGPGSWRYEISNDASATNGGGNGSGLDGVRRRITEAAGTLDVHRGEEFTVVVTIPDADRGNR